MDLSFRQVNYTIGNGIFSKEWDILMDSGDFIKL